MADVKSMESKPRQGGSPARPVVKPDNPNAQIASKLRMFYEAVQEEALPQRFLDLLEQLDAAESRAQRIR